ncbi:hypothetical protein NQ314_005728 [Rhamnusium bicolor]|uniref:DDE Tnp4 domain-containing protein n=1 Tax=Rhamnusium bicolor TaxID=1586634 RepID=A0AAV8ZG86_9CUCU|nr:hypothetical protein NQ314_005728 [Rhamnusium bicolor]
MAFDGLIHLIEENDNNRQQMRETRILQRNLRDASNPFNMPDAMFTKIFRLNKFTCQQLINNLMPHLSRSTRITRVPIHLRVLATLHFFGQGNYQTGGGHGYSFALSQRMMSINACYPGSIHDSAIWTMSGVRRLLQRLYIENETEDYLIGDSGYPLEPWLIIVPFLSPIEHSPEALFNTALSSVRISGEHTIGLWKNGFRCVHGHRALHYDPLRVAKIIYSYAVLYNMCRTFNVPMPPDDDQLQIVRLPRRINQKNLHVQPNWFNIGERRREQIVTRYFR